MSEKTDALGRSFSDICGWLPSDTAIPVGSQVIIGNDRKSLFCRYHGGQHAVVTAYHPKGRNGYWAEVSVRLVKPDNEMEAYANSGTVEASHVEIVSVGTGTVEPGVSYELCKIELLRKRFATMDHTNEGFCNPATYLAHLYLDTDSQRQAAVLRMIRSDGKINPDRLANYFRKEKLTIDEWAKYPEGFPPHHEFAYQIDWKEVADEFVLWARENAA